MPPVLALLFWTWAVIGLAVFFVRRSRRRAVADGVDRVDDTVEETVPVEWGAVEEMVPASVSAAPAPSLVPPPTPVAPEPLPPGFAEAAASVVERHTRSAPAAGIADALVGIIMPCELVPLVVDRLAGDHITLSTTGYPAEVVGTALADEIERLGYVLKPLSDTEIVATRGTTELRLSIHRPGPDGRHLEHPTARDDSVVVEISLS